MVMGLRMSRLRVARPERSACGARSPAGARALILTKRHAQVVDTELVFSSRVLVIPGR